MTSKFFAIIAGVGAGTGRSVALRFAQTYPVVLLARNPQSYTDIVSEITSSGGQALGISADTSDADSLASAFKTIKDQFKDKQLAAAIYNVGAGFAVKPFLDLTPADLESSLSSNARATASVRGSPRFATFAAGKFAARALTQSLAREFGPQGVHVAHVIVDGVIDIPGTKQWEANGGVEDGKLSADAIAESYWHLHTQHRSAFTQELDLRPYVEKF
ncbi:hypothetical protein B0T21DRAFT_379569 [Apiosordaria backusii]|uniref:Uncharacterized protein n=1 Tax=Apiosordaria backusii TaxID=314023 RepID=A0AA40EXV5_9PEZI|nr:hypothetical protein B0T21DRAFT_379569 [Apiosordaria backusii]